MPMSPPAPPKSSSISLVFTSPEGESVVPHNIQLETTRVLLFQSALPRPSVDFANRPMGCRLRAACSNLALRAIDAQREGDLAYQVVYQMELPHMREEALRFENNDYESVAEEPATTSSLVFGVVSWFKALRSRLLRSHIA